ncbi:hypothetical protein [Bacteroides sp.]|jgi:hypothetical protein|uniref:hypothetical protein n=1 Tax=Bacteroides sp. TaxID=29523 RepID=UPI002A7F9C0F|nr:hypothetical protein [Bacteroides sp.]
MGSITYESEFITDLYSFLCKHQVDIVINQIAYDKWLLDVFLKKGGEQWHREKG